VLPSPSFSRVGIRDFTFEACSGFTHVMTHRVARPPKAAFVTRLRSGQLPDPTARQLPDQSTTIWVEPPSTDDARHRGALNGDSYRLATAKKTQRRSAHGHGQNPKHQTKEILPPKSKSVLKKTKITPGFKALFS
jgi:hypothetical protein